MNIGDGIDLREGPAEIAVKTPKGTVTFNIPKGTLFNVSFKGEFGVDVETSVPMPMLSVPGVAYPAQLEGFEWTNVPAPNPSYTRLYTIEQALEYNMAALDPNDFKGCWIRVKVPTSLTMRDYKNLIDLTTKSLRKMFPDNIGKVVFVPSDIDIERWENVDVDRLKEFCRINFDMHEIDMHEIDLDPDIGDAGDNGSDGG